ncbi:DUF4258 domain-containing protein [Candidatus Pacearchaeota archaeon]|nr:DUF4258 domain-containing protein [Candidatus Pacearchaeota archaeon]
MFIITSHAKERMEKYFITEEMIKDCLSSPDKIIDTYEKRKIYQKNINGYMLRVIVEEKDINIVITCYKARRKRYEI